MILNGAMTANGRYLYGSFLYQHTLAQFRSLTCYATAVDGCDGEIQIKRASYGLERLCNSAEDPRKLTSLHY